MQGQYLFGDIPMDPNDDALYPPWVTIPNAAAQFTAFGLGPTPYTAPPDAPSNASVGLMPPLPMMGAMPNDPGLPGLPGMSAPPAVPQGGKGDGFSFSDLALPMAAGLAGAASGYATHGNPQTVLQGLSLAHRAQLMPRPEQLQQQQQQKMIHDLIMSGKLSPQALQRLGQQYPWAAPYTEAMLPTAQRQARLQSFVEGQIPGFNGTPPPAPVEPVSTGAQPGQTAPAPAASAAPGASSASGFAYLPDMSMDSKGDVTMGVKPHALPKPTDLEQRLQAIRSGQAKSPDERIALGLDKPFEEPPALQSNRAIDVIDQQIQTLSQQMQTNPHPLLERRLTELMNTRDMLAQKNAFEPKSTTGQNLFDLRTVQRLGDPYAEQTQRAAATGSSRMPMKTAQGEAGEDVRMLQQGRNMNAGDQQLQSMQREADNAALGPKAVGDAVQGSQSLDAIKAQYGEDSPEYKNANAAFQRDVLKKAQPSFSDTNTVRSQSLQMSKDYSTARNNYRQIESVMKAPITPQTERVVVMSLMHVLEPDSAVMKGEYDTIRETTAIPDAMKRWILENWSGLGQGRILTDTQVYDMVDQARRVYASRLQSHTANMKEMSGVAERNAMNPADVIVYQPDGLDRGYLNPAPVPTAVLQAAKQRADTLAPPTDAANMSRNNAIFRELILRAGYNPYGEVAQ